MSQERVNCKPQTESAANQHSTPVRQDEFGYIVIMLYFINKIKLRSFIIN